jgi:Autotransporter beta-domain
MKNVLQHNLKTILGIFLLQFSSGAIAFTLIELTPSSTIISSPTLNTQVQPITGAIKKHLLNTRRKSKAVMKAEYYNILAANSYVDSISDLDHINIAYNDLAGVGSAMGSSTDDSKSLWMNSTFTSLKNELAQTQFAGGVHILLAGYDYTFSDKYIFGVALSHETSSFYTRFNRGNVSTNGFSVSPYFAYLLSETWSYDISLGHGKSRTDQYRTFTVGLNVIDLDSAFSSSRNFAATNLTNVATMGNWKLSSSLGYFATDQIQDSYYENGAISIAVKSATQTARQWNIGAESAYTHRDSESYVGLIYEKNATQDTANTYASAQPFDDSSYVLSAGWRYFGKELTANLTFNSRLGQDNTTENSFSTTLRIDL